MSNNNKYINKNGVTALAEAERMQLLLLILSRFNFAIIPETVAGLKISIGD